jgi:hypothetical protein
MSVTPFLFQSPCLQAQATGRDTSGTSTALNVELFMAFLQRLKASPRWRAGRLPR